MNLRTDLAIERIEYVSGKAEGIIKKERRTNETKTTVIDVVDELGAKTVGKPIGKYITLESMSFVKEQSISEECIYELVRCIKELMPKKSNTALVVGVGNPDITSDALGPMFCDKIFATRHIDEKMKKSAGIYKSLRSVCCISTDVLGKTGIESAEYIKYITNGIKPDFIIAVDALCSLDLKRLGTTVQLSNTGISPGSGVGNKRVSIDEKSLGIPVIAIGVPTVVSAFTLAKNITGEENDIAENENNKEFSDMIVTPKDIDVLIKNASFLLSVAVNSALQPYLSLEEVIGLIS